MLDPVSVALDLGDKLISRLWPDPEERDKAKIRLFELQQSGELAQLTAETDLAKAQLSVNEVEASKDAVFVSGWRPFVGWVCGTGFFYHIILEPFIVFIAAMFGHSVDMPVFNHELMTTTLFGMLGIGTLRSYDKYVQRSTSPRQIRKTDSK